MTNLTVWIFTKNALYSLPVLIWSKTLLKKCQKLMLLFQKLNLVHFLYANDLHIIIHMYRYLVRNTLNWWMTIYFQSHQIVTKLVEGGRRISLIFQNCTYIYRSLVWNILNWYSGHVECVTIIYASVIFKICFFQTNFLKLSIDGICCDRNNFYIYYYLYWSF